MENFNKILLKARKEGYAIPHFNCNSPDWIRVVLKAAQKMNSPVIVAGVADQIRWMAGGFKTWVSLLADLIKENSITVPAIGHLDHATYEECIEALDGGMKSVMFDGSYLSFSENLKKTKELIKIVNEKNASLEVEVGSIGGEEAGKINYGELASIDDCKEMSKTGIGVLTAGIGNIHGDYPSDWRGLNFERMTEIAAITDNIPLGLHGGSGIPDDQIKRAIKLGVSKINVHTEVLIGFLDGMINDVTNTEYSKVRHPLDLHKGAHIEMSKVVEKKILLFNSQNKA